MKKTIKQLIAKAQDSSNRMPSITAIHNLLESKNIAHSFYDSINVVEHRSGRNRYTNDRHDGKEGKELTVSSKGIYLALDTSDSYYSWNSHRYAVDLCKILNLKY